MKRVVLIFGLLSLTCPAMAEFDNGNAVLQMRTSEKAFNQGVCVGLVSGYFEVMLQTYTCSRYHPDVTRRQVKYIVIKFLKDNPADRHLPGVTLAWRAIVAAFDCKEKTN